MQIERAALHPRVAASIPFIDRHVGALPLQQARQRKAARAAADDRDLLVPG